MYSDNVAHCLRTAMFIKQGIVDEKDMKAKIASNATSPVDYDQIAEDIVPTFIASDVRANIKRQVANYTAIKLDNQILRLSNYSYSMYQYAYGQGIYILKYC